MNIAVRTDAETDTTVPARVFTMQRLAYRRDGPPERPQRLAALKALDATLRAHKDAIAQAISADFGNRAVPETILAELAPTLSAIRHTSKHLARWMRPERRHVGLSTLPGRAWVEYRPLGCVGILSPWNYPLLLSMGPLVDALGAGNRVLLKPSELTPALLRPARPPAGRRHRPGAGLRRDRRPGDGAGRLRAAVRPPGVHRVDPCRPRGDARGGGEPHPP
ncbi:MAG: aldehyde dehydrogenase family protein [Acetobacteraceae bacterium]